MIEQPYAVLVSKDLFFVSRITGTANGFGWKVISAFPSQAADHAGNANCRGFLIDLTTPGMKIEELMTHIGTDLASIGFGPHVQTVRLEAAQAAGCKVVLPRSRFDSTLNEILAELFADAE